MHYELAEKGPIRVSCGKCLSGRSQVRRLAPVYGISQIMPFVMIPFSLHLCINDVITVKYDGSPYMRNLHQ